MLGRTPSGVVAGLSTKATLWALNGFEPPRQQPLAAVCPSLSKEGSNIFIECGSATRQQSLLKIPSSEGWRGSAGVGSPTSCKKRDACTALLHLPAKFQEVSAVSINVAGFPLTSNPSPALGRGSPVDNPISARLRVAALELPHACESASSGCFREYLCRHCVRNNRSSSRYR